MSYERLRHLYRDRRRIAVSLVLLFGIALLGANTLPDPIPGPVPSEILSIFPILAAIPFVTLRFRRHRHWIEVVFLGTFLYLALARALPDSPWDYGGIYGLTPVGALAYASSIWAARQFLYGHWADRFTRPGKIAFSAKAHSRLPVDALWYGLVPTPGQLERNPDPEVVSIDYASADRRTIRLVTWQPPRRAGETLIHIDQIDPLRSVTLRLEIISGLREAETEGTTRFEIHDHGPYRSVIVSHEIEALSPRRMLGGWLDDRLGRMMDTRLATVERGTNRRGRRRAALTLEDWWVNPEDIDAAREGRGAKGYRPAYGRSLSAREHALLSGAAPQDTARTEPLPNSAASRRGPEGSTC